MTMHCDQFPSSFAERPTSEADAVLQHLEVLSTDFSNWCTTYRCRICGQLWVEEYVVTGHGDVPVLRKLVVESVDVK